VEQLAARSITPEPQINGRLSLGSGDLA